MGTKCKDLYLKIETLQDEVKRIEEERKAVKSARHEARNKKKRLLQSLPEGERALLDFGMELNRGRKKAKIEAVQDDNET
jgi:hypothetical protein